MKDFDKLAKAFVDEIYDYYLYEFEEVDYEEKELKHLAHWQFMWFEFEILFYWKWWPCAYIRIPDNCIELVWILKHNWYECVPKSEVHWWFSFGKYIQDNDDNFRKFTEGWRIGRDYWHCDDYVDYMKDTSIADKLKKWTTKEILEEVIRQILVWRDAQLLY